MRSVVSDSWIGSRGREDRSRGMGVGQRLWFIILRWVESEIIRFGSGACGVDAEHTGLGMGACEVSRRG